MFVYIVCVYGAVTAPGTDSSLNFRSFFFSSFFSLALVKYCQHYKSGKECEVKSFESKVEKTTAKWRCGEKNAWEGMLQVQGERKKREEERERERIELSRD